MKRNACNIDVIVFHRAIEDGYKKYCEQNSKDQSKYLDFGPSEDLMLSDSTVWTKVQKLLLRLKFGSIWSDWLFFFGQNICCMFCRRISDFRSFAVI